MSKPNIHVRRESSIEVGSCVFCHRENQFVKLVSSLTTNFSIRICSRCLNELKEKTVSPSPFGTNVHPLTYRIKIKDNPTEGYWYEDLAGETFTVIEVTKLSEVRSVKIEDRYEMEDLWVVHNGENQEDIILKKDAEIISEVKDGHGFTKPKKGKTKYGKEGK